MVLEIDLLKKLRDILDDIHHVKCILEYSDLESDEIKDCKVVLNDCYLKIRILKSLILHNKELRNL